MWWTYIGKTKSTTRVPDGDQKNGASLGDEYEHGPAGMAMEEGIPRTHIHDDFGRILVHPVHSVALRLTRRGACQ